MHPSPESTRKHTFIAYTHHDPIPGLPLNFSTSSLLRRSLADHAVVSACSQTAHRQRRLWTRICLVLTLRPQARGAVGARLAVHRQAVPPGEASLLVTTGHAPRLQMPRMKADISLRPCVRKGVGHLPRVAASLAAAAAR